MSTGHYFQLSVSTKLLQDLVLQKIAELSERIQQVLATSSLTVKEMMSCFSQGVFKDSIYPTIPITN